MSVRHLLIGSALSACAFAGAGLLSPTMARGDVVHLKDGTKLEGTLKKNEDGYDVIRPDGSVTKVSSREVKSVELKTVVTPEDAQRRYDSMRRSTDHLADLKVIIGRYRDFIAKHPGTPAAEAAKKELAVWQDRQQKSMTKAGDQWVTPEELGAIQEHSLAGAIHARRLLKLGRVKEAGPILDQALKEDPTNASAHYLRGVMLFRQEQFGPARKAFEAVQPLVPDHAPTLNNIAVTLWRQNQPVAALGAYEAAMLAAPGEPVILNNVAEALHALPEEHRESQVARKVARRFNEQDDVLAEAMAKDGRYRWGAAWVTGEQLDRLQAKEKEIQDKIDVLEEQFQEAKAQLDQIDQDIADTERSLRRIEADSHRREASGRSSRRPLPGIYYDLRQDLEDLGRERDEQAAVIDGLRRDARKVQQEMPVPRYAGAQRLIEVEGTPLVPRDPPAGAEADADPAGGPPAPPRRDDRLLPDAGAVTPSIPPANNPGGPREARLPTPAAEPRLK